jgi:hypothetical protein
MMLNDDFKKRKVLKNKESPFGRPLLQSLVFTTCSPTWARTLS